MKRLIWIPLLVCALFAAAPYLPAGLLRTRVAAALERSINRPVEIGDIRFTFFPAGPVPGPGFVLENVTIHEDPRAGIEPFAHMGELGASIRLFSLLRGKLELSGISLGDATINCVKTQDNAWNIQFLVESNAQKETTLPAIRMRGGRVNFKFGDTKSVFYFDDADLDIDGPDINFGGAPSRTDKSAQDFGRFFVRGTATSQRLDLRAELERSSLEEALRLMDPHGFGVHGIVALDASISGEPSALKVTGNVQVGDIHRWDLLPSGDSLRLAYNGTLDLRGERLELTSTSKLVNLEFKAFDLLKTPTWEASADLQKIPLATLFEIGHHMGATLPENLKVAGSVSGTASYNQRNGLSGQLSLGEASLTLPDREPVTASEARVTIVGAAVRLAPTVVQIGEDQTAQIDGIVTLAEPRTLDLTINTKGLSVAAMQSFGLSEIPIIQQTPKGTWKGWARYREGGWSGESELRGALIQLDGLADPIEIETATVILRGKRVAVEKVKAKAGATAFKGSYSFDPAAKRPHKFNILVDEADAGEVERLLGPALLRSGGGFLARTLGLSTPTPPVWLKNRRAEGTVRIDSLSAGASKIGDVKATFWWEGTHLILGGTASSFNAALDLDLSASTSKYQLKGTLTGAAAAAREASFQSAGSVDSEGSGAKLLEAALEAINNP